jgi:hypothetical protein
MRRRCTGHLYWSAVCQIGSWQPSKIRIAALTVLLASSASPVWFRPQSSRQPLRELLMVAPAMLRIRAPLRRVLSETASRWYIQSTIP